jgi:hypothetical protein
MSFPALTFLELHEIDNPPPLKIFLELLRGLATLQVLDMENSLPFAEGADRAIGLITPIYLPSLQHLRLSSTKNLKEVSNILFCVTVPPTATLRFLVTIGTSEESLTDVDVLASSFSAFVSHLGQFISYGTLHIVSAGPGSCTYIPNCVTPSGHIHMRAWIDHDVSSLSRIAPNLEVVVAQRNRSTPNRRQNVVRKIFPSLPFFDITTLTLEINPVGDLLQYTIGNLPRLQGVTVVGDCIVDFIKELRRRRKDDDDRQQLSDHYSVTFPALESLWIREGDFSKERSCTVEELQDCLMERCERKAELLKLKLTNCRELFRSHVEKLREIVVDVEWDEREPIGFVFWDL